MKIGMIDDHNAGRSLSAGVALRRRRVRWIR